MSCQKLDDETLFPLFESCHKVELKLSKLMTAVVWQDFVLALFFLLFQEWIYLIMWQMGGIGKSLAGGRKQNGGFGFKMGGIKPSGHHDIFKTIIYSIC